MNIDEIEVDKYYYVMTRLGLISRLKAKSIRNNWVETRKGFILPVNMFKSEDECINHYSNK